MGELHAGFGNGGGDVGAGASIATLPSNIIVTGANYTPDDGLTFSSLVIIDLGIARVWRAMAPMPTPSKFGTRPYAPPSSMGLGDRVQPVNVHRACCS